MSFISRRTDLSEWLIHFVRDRDIGNDFPGDQEGYDGIVGNLESDASAISVLRNILAMGGILPGYSFRAGRTTIYGGRPAVCLTEAPLHGFAQYVKDRGQARRSSPYGVCLLKREVFAAGGRPVIYGLSCEGPPRLVKDRGCVRILDETTLPLHEQYRYIAYDPGRGKPLDWTHEREWRWIATKHDSHSICYEGLHGADNYPALPLFRSEADGGLFSQVGVITRTREEAGWVAETLLRYRDAGCNDYEVPFAQDVLARSFVVPLEEALASGANRIEDLSDVFRLIARRPAPAAETKKRVAEAVEKARLVSEKAANAYVKSRGGTDAIRDVCGNAWVITKDSASEVTAALLELSLAVPRADYYIVDAIGRLPQIQALGFYEAAANAAAECLETELGQSFGIRAFWD